MPGERIGNSNQYLTISGVVSAPAYSWASDNNTGLYRIGADNIGVAANGAKVLDIATTGLTVTGAFASSNGVSSTLTTDSTSTTTGSIITAGGISTQKALFVGTTSNFAGTMTAAAATLSGLLTINGVAATANKSIQFSSTTTAANYIRFDNTSAALLIGVESSAGGTIVSGTSAYSSFISAGTSTALQFATNNSVRATIDSSGNLGIGMTPTRVLDITQSQNAASIGRIFNGTSGTAGSAEWRASNDANDSIRLISINQSYTTSGLFVARKSVIASDGVGLAITTMSAQAMQFGINNTEAARIDSSGNYQFGTTTNVGSASFGTTIFSNGSVQVSQNTTGAAAVLAFYNPNGSVGSIQTSGSSTSYVTSSDYRLKENVQPMTGGLATVAALKPVNYDWIIDKSAGEGFIAHELQDVIPAAVTGEKDAVDDKGEIKPQGVDFSKIVPHLVAAIQELTTRLAALENKT